MALEAAVMQVAVERLGRHALVVAIAVACTVPGSARAQRITPAALVSARSAAEQTPAGASRATSLVPIAADTSSAASNGQSHAVALGAIAGAILGAWYGHGVGGNCDGSSGTQAHCRQTLLIGGTAVSAVLGALAGHLVELGEERDARRALRRTAADSASTPAPVRP